MGKKSKQQKNPVVKKRLDSFAAIYGLEIVEYQHVTVDRMRYALLVIQSLAQELAASGDDAGVTLDRSTGMRIAVKKRATAANPSPVS